MVSGRSCKVILVGTDPCNIRGGIGTAMQGYARSLRGLGLLFRLVPSYSPVARCGRWLLAVKAIPLVLRSIFQIRRSGGLPIHYGHTGSWPSMVREGFLAFLSRLCGARTLLQLHSPAVDAFLAHPIGRFLFRLAVLPAHALGGLTPWWQSRLAGAGIGKPVVVIPNPLPLELEAAALAAGGHNVSAAQRNDGIVTVLSMARLVVGKGVETVIEAMQQLPEHVHLIVAGDGPLRADLERLAQEKGVADRVRFAGWVAAEGKAELLASVDIFCLPSRNDSFGMCFLEAMAHAVPVVALGWGPIRDVVPDGKAGILVEEASPDRVAGAIRRLLDADYRKVLGEGGRRWVLQEFSAEAVGRKFQQALSRLFYV